MTLKELRETAGRLAAEIRKQADAAQGRVMTAEEQTNWDKVNKEYDENADVVKREERAAGVAAAAASTQPPRAGAEDTEERITGQAREHRFVNRLTGRERVLPISGGARSSAEYIKAFTGFLRGGPNPVTMPEFRALQMDVDASGGFTVPPEQFVAKLIQAVDDLVFIRGLATVITVAGADKLGAASLDADPADPDWTTELAVGSEDSTMAFGKRELNPHPLAKLIKISNKLMRASAFDPEALVRARLAYKFAIAQEKAFLLGTGAGQPLGLFIASADGVPTSRDVVTGSATDFTGAGIIDAFYALKVQYQRTASWLFNRTAVAKIRKLADSTGQFIWQQGLQAGQPDSILTRPVLQSEYVPNTFTTGLYVGMVGDFSFYWIADALSVTLQRLVELYAATNQTGFIGRVECDGMPVLAEAFSRLKTS